MADPCCFYDNVAMTFTVDTHPLYLSVTVYSLHYSMSVCVRVC